MKIALILMSIVVTVTTIYVSKYEKCSPFSVAVFSCLAQGLLLNWSYNDKVYQQR